MSVKQLPNGLWRVLVREGGRGSKQHSKNDIPTQYEAFAYEDFLLKKFGKTRHSYLTFAELAKKYEAYYGARLKSAKAKKETMDALVKHFGSYKVCTFNAVMIEDYQNQRLQAGGKKLKDGTVLPNSPATVNRHVANLKAMFTWAEKRQFVTKEVCEAVHSVEMLDENNKRLRYLTREEANRLLFQCADHIKPIVTVALYAGMRKGELVNLKWSQVDMVNGFILLEGGDTKNGERREIPINQTVRNVLMALVRSTSHDKVFWNPETGQDMSFFRKAFTNALKRSKIQNFRFHDLRHTFASWLVQQGTPIKTVQELLGHKSLTMTMRYAHLAPDQKKDAVNMLDGKDEREEMRSENLR